MSAPLPFTGCCSSCGAPNTSGTGQPGPPGPRGAPGLNGTDGVDAFTTVTIQFTQPIVGNFVTVNVANSTWITPGQILYVQNGGYYTAVNVPNSATVTLVNLGYAGNSVPGSIILVTSKVGPAGIKGTDGQNGSSGSGSVFITTGDPNGVITAQRPADAYDPSTLNRWAKTDSGLTNTGWVQYIAGP